MTRYTLTYNTIVKVLSFAPEGWSDVTTQIVRNDRYMGLFRQVSANMRFVEDGAAILREAYYSDGCDANVYLKIEAFDPLTMEWDVILSAGEIDFTDVVDSRDYFEVPVIDGGLSAKVKANENVKYTLGTPANTILNYTGIRLYAGSTVQQQSTYNLDPDPSNRCFSTYSQGKYSIPENIIVNTDTSQGGYTIYANDEPVIGSPTLPTNPIIRANRYTKFDLEISAPSVGMLTALNEDYYNGGTEQDRWYFYVQLNTYSAAGALKNSTTLDSGSVIPTNKIGNVYQNSVGTSMSYSATDILLDENEYVKLEFGWYPTDSAQQTAFNAAALFVSGLNIEMSVQSVLPTIEIRAYTGKELFAALINEMSPGSPVKSTFMDEMDLDSIPLFVSGDGIRQITPYNLKIKFVDFFDSLRAIYDVGFGIELIGGVETAVIERRSYFYKTTSPLHIGEVSELSVSSATDMLYKTLNIGYATNEYKELNGRDEFNAAQQWVTGFKRINTEAAWQSPIRADMYGIDNLRITYTGNTDTDTDSDNSVFIVDSEFVEEISGVKYYQVSRDKITYVDGLINADTAYNVALSPKRCLLQRKSELAAMCWGQNDDIKLSSGDKNTSISSTISGVFVNEHSSIPIASLGAPLYYPIIFDCSMAQPSAAWVALMAAGNNVISFTYNGVTMYGYIMEIGVNVDHRAVISLRLLCSYLTDLNKLK